MAGSEMHLVPGTQLAGSSIAEGMSTRIQLWLQHIWAVPVLCTVRAGAETALCRGALRSWRTADVAAFCGFSHSSAESNSHCSGGL